MSEVEQFWNATCAKFGIDKKWSSLTGEEQEHFVMAVNIIITLIHRK